MFRSNKLLINSRCFLSTILIALVLLVGLGSSQGVSANNKMVSGSVVAFFTQFEFLGEQGGSIVFSVEVQGNFELIIEGEMQTGTYTFPHILSFPTVPSGSPFLAGASAWMFDNGVTCTGTQQAVGEQMEVITNGRFDCSDGSRLMLTITDTFVDPGVSVTSEINGKRKKKTSN